MKEELSISINQVTKTYKLYERPIDRLKEAFSLSRKKYSIEKNVLSNLNLNIKKGDVVGIVGINGSGKSTLLKMVTGVVSPTSGNIIANGKIAALLELGAGFNPEFTGIKNIFLNGTMMGFSHSEMEDRLQSIIDFADIGEFIYHPVKLYSSGMFARLAFAVATNVEPDILIVDEALSVGDIRFQIKCMDKMKSMMDRGVTVLFVSHDINAIRRFCTKCLWLKNGEMVSYGETNRVCDMYMDYLKILDSDSGGNITNRDSISTIDFKKSSKYSVAEIVDVLFKNKNGKEIKEIDLYEPLTVEVHYNVYDEKIANAVMGVALKRIDDEYICGLNTLLDKQVIPWNYGRNIYKLEYEQGIRVLGGAYYFDIALFDKTATVAFHYAAKIKELMVTADYIGEGICILPHRWNE